MLAAYCLLVSAYCFLLLLLLLSVGRWIPYFWLLLVTFSCFGYFGYRIREFEFKNFAFAFRVGNE